MNFFELKANVSFIFLLFFVEAIFIVFLFFQLKKRKLFELEALNQYENLNASILELASMLEGKEEKLKQLLFTKAKEEIAIKCKEREEISNKIEDYKLICVEEIENKFSEYNYNKRLLVIELLLELEQFQKSTEELKKERDLFYEQKDFSSLIRKIQQGGEFFLNKLQQEDFNIEQQTSSIKDSIDEIVFSLEQGIMNKRTRNQVKSLDRKLKQLKPVLQKETINQAK